jgi:hypothetical protein
MLVPDSTSGGTMDRTRSERPPPCHRCAAASWWNGWRQVFAVVGRPIEGTCSRCAHWIPRAKCSSCRRSFTCRPPELYPERQFSLDVVADVAAAIAIGFEPAAKAATRATASSTSARRWMAWIARLAPPAVLLAAAQRIDPGAPIGAGTSAFESTLEERKSQAARVLGALEELGSALVRCGVALVSRTGLGRVLEWQHREHGDVVRLCAEPRCLSPAMALGLSGGGL